MPAASDRRRRSWAARSAASAAAGSRPSATPASRPSVSVAASGGAASSATTSSSTAASSSARGTARRASPDATASVGPDAAPGQADLHRTCVARRRAPAGRCRRGRARCPASARPCRTARRRPRSAGRRPARAGSRPPMAWPCTAATVTRAGWRSQANPAWNPAMVASASASDMRGDAGDPGLPVDLAARRRTACPGRRRTRGPPRGPPRPGRRRAASRRSSAAPSHVGRRLRVQHLGPGQRDRRPRAVDVEREPAARGTAVGTGAVVTPGTLSGA